MIKFLVAALVTLTSLNVFAHESESLDGLKDTISLLFEKPVFTSLPLKKLPSHEFNNRIYKKQKTQFKKENYISNFLKVRELSLVETETGVLIIESRDAMKTSTPVFKERIPKQTREQIVTLIKTIPAKFKGDDSRIDRALRSFYSPDGDIKVSANQESIIITDWLSNTKRMLKVIDSL